MLKLYNTLTRKKEIFKPIKKDKVNMFVCGPTTYDYAHIGHAKTYVQFDIMVRYLRFRKFKVFYLQNITDIDDKIINRAKQKNQDPIKLSRGFERYYYEDMNNLGVKSIDKYARATNHIKEIISQISRLIKKGYAYETKGGIYFNVEKFKDYGKLSKQNMEKIKSGIRIEVREDKKNPIDFALWKKTNENPKWKSPWNYGRPGWHIEDTAITEKYFGPKYDIHGGAIDLIFPHHEAEIAQMESISSKKPLVRYWLHTGFLNIRSKKMSKSLGNFITIRDALKKYDYKVLRFFYATAHYRGGIDFNEKSLEQAKNSLERINQFIRNLNLANSKDNKKVKVLIQKAEKKFMDAMNDDINTPKAFSIIFDFIRDTNKIKFSKKDSLLIKKFMFKIDKIFEILEKEKKIKLNQNIKNLIKKREKARKEKNFGLADKIRDQLKEKDILLEDTKEGIKWKIINK